MNACVYDPFCNVVIVLPLSFYLYIDDCLYDNGKRPQFRVIEILFQNM